MSGSQNNPRETGEQFIARKYLQFRKICDEALEAGALVSPTYAEQLEPVPGNDPNKFLATIRISFVIKEGVLHEFRQKKLQGG